MRAAFAAVWHVGQRFLPAEMGVAQSGSRSPVVRLLQRNLRHNGVRCEAAAHLMLQIALGGDPIWNAVDVGLEPAELESEPEPAEQLRIAGGFEHARTATLTLNEKTYGPLLPIQTPLPDLVERFTPGGWLPVTNWPTIVAEATDRELHRARDDTRALVEPLLIFVAALEALAARGGLGLSLLTRLERATGGDFPLLWVPYWIVWRRTSTKRERRNFRFLGRALRLATPAAKLVLAGTQRREVSA